MTWKAWGVSLVNAGISGLASGLLSAGVGVDWKKSLLIAGGSAIVSITKWIVQHPLPGSVAE